MPLLQTHIESIINLGVDDENQQQQEYSKHHSPSTNTAICSAVLAAVSNNNIRQRTTNRRSYIFTIPHACELPVVRTSLDQARIPYHLATSVRDALDPLHDDKISLLVRSAVSTLETAVQESPSGSTITAMDSSWTLLQDEIRLFGDNIPRNGPGIAKCIVPNKKLCLCLTDWGAACHPTQQAAATMNPWTRLIAISDFVQLLSGRSSDFPAESLSTPSLFE